MKGISTNQYCTRIAPCIKKANNSFIIRYYSRTTKQPEKRMLPTEALAISKAGLKVGVVYQDAANKIKFFTKRRGIKDGQYAYKYAQEEIGQPKNSAIYFAVDYDFNKRQIQGAVANYFEGVYKGFQIESGGSPNYDIGVYGSGATCRIIRSKFSFVKYSWLALARLWREYKTYKDWDIKQYLVRTKLCGLKRTVWQRVDSKGYFGEFVV